MVSIAPKDSSSNGGKDFNDVPLYSSIGNEFRQRKNGQFSTTMPPPPSSTLHLLDDEKSKYSKVAGREEDWLDQLIVFTCLLALQFTAHSKDGIFRYDARTVMEILLITVLALASRFYNIHKGNFVIWDEAHFGSIPLALLACKFGSHYLKREFYFDVHPPLGKITVALAGLFANYRGDFEFESGKEYPENLNYTVMRVFLATFGALMVPIAYMTGIEFGLSKKAALLAAVMVLCDGAFLSISRYILLDSMLLFYTVLTFYCMSVFHNQRKKPFSSSWWFWLAATGTSIGLVSSVKWVGFFVTALVGLNTIEDLWQKFGDVTQPLPKFVRHFGARALCLILLPIAVYTASFFLHFAILSHSGPGDAQMPSLFQAQLVGNSFHENPLHLAYGSKISLKNNGYAGGLLHSHVQAYPAGSKQQQVTCYHHKDSNNEWILKKIRGAPAVPEGEEDPLEFVKHGDLVRIVHSETERNLHSHPVAAPVTKTDYEVSGYGNETIGDSNDHWIFEVVDDLQEDDQHRIHSLTTRFRLRHQNLKCLLRSHNVHLPQWGFKQAEVVCDKHNRTDSNNIWNVEQHWNERLPPGSPEQYKTSFWKDFIHLNVAMWSSNNALVPDPDKEDKLTSSPRQWPFLEVGLRMCGWSDDKFKVYLMGNPIVWWSSTISLGLFIAVWFFYVLRFRRGYNDWIPGEWEQFFFQGKTFLMGWFLHFVPFCIMGRVTYLHHYFPALYFSILMAAFMTDHFASYLPRLVRPILHLTLGAVVVYVFWMFSPLSYGFEGPANNYAHLKWVPTWTMVD